MVKAKRPSEVGSKLEELRKRGSKVKKLKGDYAKLEKQVESAEAELKEILFKLVDERGKCVDLLNEIALLAGRHGIKDLDLPPLWQLDIHSEEEREDSLEFYTVLKVYEKKAEKLRDAWVAATDRREIPSDVLDGYTSLLEDIRRSHFRDEDKETINGRVVRSIIVALMKMVASYGELSLEDYDRLEAFIEQFKTLKHVKYSDVEELVFNFKSYTSNDPIAMKIFKRAAK